MSLPHIFGPLTGQVPLAYLDDNFSAVVALVSTSVAPAGTNDFRLILSGGNLTLQPVNGNNVDIGGTIYSYTAMPILSASGLTPATLYYIYLTDLLGIATLEAIETAYTIDAKGRAYKTGDATRRLMGMAQPVAGPAWADSLTQRLVVSYGNRRPLALRNKFTVARSLVNQSTYTEINSEIRIGLLLWADSGLLSTISGSGYGTESGSQIGAAICVDSGMVPYGQGLLGITPGIGSSFPVSQVSTRVWHPGEIVEGYHYLTVMGRNDGFSTTAWYGAGSDPDLGLAAQLWG